MYAAAIACTRKEKLSMLIAIGTVVPPAMLPAGGTVLVSIGAPLVIAVLVATLVAIGAVLVQGALCASPERRPAVLVETRARDAA
jgi:hypothetical protein